MNNIYDFTAKRILEGHTTKETAYLVKDYPYGFKLRCKIRYWLEFKSNKGFRMVSQTTNPKKSITVWNKPKASTYSLGMAKMYLDENDHVQWRILSPSMHSGDQFYAFSRGFKGMLTEKDLEQVALLERFGRKINPTSWAQADVDNRQQYFG